MVERDIFKEPLSRAEIEGLVQGSAASEMFNFRSPAFRKRGLDRDKLTEDDLIKLMLEEPRLIKRPVVRIGDHVYFGASEARLREILG